MFCKLMARRQAIKSPLRAPAIVTVRVIQQAVVNPPRVVEPGCSTWALPQAKADVLDWPADSLFLIRPGVPQISGPILVARLPEVPTGSDGCLFHHVCYHIDSKRDGRRV